jgi:hypothetical protein
MKIKCINNKDEYWEYYLTLDKTYEVIEINDDNYYIINYKNYYLKEWFKPLSEIRNEKIDKLLGI